MALLAAVLEAQANSTHSPTAYGHVASPYLEQARPTPKVSGIPPDPLYAFKGPKQYEQEQESADKTKLQEVIEQHVPSGISAQAVVKEGDAADEIVRVAESEGADLIIIATHGLSGWRHMVFGSTAEKIARQAPCAVLIRQITSHSRN